MITYEAFCVLLEQRVARLVPDVTVAREENEKLSLRRTSDDGQQGSGAIISLRHWYTRYQSGDNFEAMPGLIAAIIANADPERVQRDMEWDRVRDRLFPRIEPTRMVDQRVLLDTYQGFRRSGNVLTKPYVPGILTQTIWLDSDTTMMAVTDGYASQWGVTPDDIWSAAYANALKQQKQPGMLEQKTIRVGPNDVPIWGTLNGNGYDTAVLLTDGYLLDRMATDMAMVFMPDRDTVVAVAIETVNECNVIALILQDWCAGVFAKSPYPVCEAPLLVSRSGVSLAMVVAYKDDDDDVSQGVLCA